MKDLVDIVRRLSGRRLLVVGDIMVDEYIWGDATRISPEAPVPVVEVRKEELRLGGAANVAANVRSLGGEVILVGAVGDDALAEFLMEELSRRGIEGEGIIVDRARPTTVKTRVIAGSQQIVRFDKESVEELQSACFDRLLGNVRERISEAEGLIVADYGKGVISASLLRAVIPEAIRQERIVSVDPKDNHFPLYRGVTVITPNHKEAGAAAGRSIKTEEDLDAVGNKLLAELQAQAVLITRGAQGMRLYERDKPPLQIDTVAREVYDVVGAGDTVVAALTLALVTGASLEEAARISNHAAGVVVGKKGTATVALAELEGSLRANGKGA